MHKGIVICVIEIVDFVDLFFGDDENVAFGLWMDVEEGDGFVVFVDFVGGDFAVNDFGEDATHFWSFALRLNNRCRNKRWRRRGCR